MHYGRIRRNGTPYITLKPSQCSVPQCNNKIIAKGFCNVHYRRMLYHGRLHTVKRPDGTGTLHPEGYISVRHNGIAILEHRRIMQEYLGRPLEKYEHIHHKNGNTFDNRIENLQIVTNSKHYHIHSLKLQKARINAYIPRPRCCLTGKFIKFK